MNFRKSQSGFSAVELLIVVAVVGVLGFAGYLVYIRQQDKTKTAESSQPAAQQSKADDVPNAPDIKTTSDLDKASDTLDKMDTDSDTTQLDSELQAF